MNNRLPHGAGIIVCAWFMFLFWALLAYVIFAG